MGNLFNEVINDMKIILDDEFNGVETEVYIKLANETKEKFKDNLRLSFHQALLVDKMFDEFLESL